MKAKKKPTRDQFTVVLEDMRDQFRAFGDMQMGMNDKLDSHSKILDGHSKILESHTQMIGQILVDMQEVKQGLNQKVDVKDFARLEKRVVIIETKLAKRS